MTEDIRVMHDKQITSCLECIWTALSRYKYIGTTECSDNFKNCPLPKYPTISAKNDLKIKDTYIVAIEKQLLLNRRKNKKN